MRDRSEKLRVDRQLPRPDGTVARPFPPWHSFVGRHETGRREEAVRKLLGVAALAAAIGLTAGAKAQIILSGNDEKATYNDAGQTVVGPPGKDTVSIIDIRNRTKPSIVATLPLINTIVGPPTNLAVTPDQKLAIVVNSLDEVQDGDKWKLVPDDKVFVIDLTAKPPAIIATLHAGKQASGMAINRAGTLALIANRADNTVSVLTIIRQGRQGRGHGGAGARWHAEPAAFGGGDHA